MILILDLDDTIFQTKSMNPKVLDSAVSIITKYYDSDDSRINSEEIISELWSNPIDIVFSKYSTPAPVVSAYYSQIEMIDFTKMNITTFEDYYILKSIPCKKILVTTGLKELQIAKIRALGIEFDFDSIYIDDPRLNPRKNKIDIFNEILIKTQCASNEIYVIGDNPNSEIMAGKKLGMITIQRKSVSKESSVFSDYEIESFEELQEIIK